MGFSIFRFACAAVAAAIVVPCVAIGIQFSTISLSNGNGPGIMAALAAGVSALPLAMLAAPLNGIGACMLGAFSLGTERLLGRRSIFIWLFHGLAIGCLSLAAFNKYRSDDGMIVGGVMGSWLFGGLVMWSCLSARTAPDVPAAG